ncbi:hypothetical protein Pcinc_034017, partial [Petrolisthes cinctipes]
MNHSHLSNGGGEPGAAGREFNRRRRTTRCWNRRKFLQDCLEELVLPKTAPKQLRNDDNPLTEAGRKYLLEECEKLTLNIYELFDLKKSVSLSRHQIRKLAKDSEKQKEKLHRKLRSLCENSAWSSMGDILVEDGAEWINGSVANRLFGLAKRLNALTNPIPASAYDWQARTWDETVADARGYDAAARLFEKCDEPGIQVNYYTTGYGKCYIDRFDKVYKNSRAVAREKAGWYQYLHMKSVPDNKIRTSTPVCKILWDQPGGKDVVLVVTQGGDAYLASHVIFTASIGHLKDRHTHLFEPQLPQSYRDAMN